MQISTLLVILSTVTLGSALPSRYVFKGYCCFGLQDASNGYKVQQDMRSGLLSFNSGLGDGWYCLNSNRKDIVLRDSAYNACILDPYNQFQCLDPIAGSDVWTVRRNGDTRILYHEGSSFFSACSTGKGEEVYGSKPPSQLKCRKPVQLKVVGMSGSCDGF